jgi:glucose-1-phosphate cytidylyltransferase
MLTWCDGLSDVNLHQLRDRHERHGRIGTLAAVHPAGRFGRLVLSGDRVVTFQEKVQDPSEWINGAFFVFNEPVAQSPAQVALTAR